MLDFPGFILFFAQQHLLIYGPDAEALGEPLFGPPVHLRPGYRFRHRADYLLPTEVIDDVGQHLLAPDCYDWLEQRGDAYPRADMIGLLAASGEKHTAFIKELDLVELTVFAEPAARLDNSRPVRVDLAIEALAVPDGYALTPTDFPLPLFARALPCYRLAPGVFGATGAAILAQLLASGRRDWRLTFDQLDDLLADG